MSHHPKSIVFYCWGFRGMYCLCRKRTKNGRNAVGMDIRQSQIDLSKRRMQEARQ